MPDSDTLLAWAAEPHKYLAVNILFHNSAGGSVIETLSLATAYCVSYQEEFISGEREVGAYRCFLTLFDPTGFIIQAGSPSTNFTLPTAREHGTPPSEALKTISISASQVFRKNDADPLHDILGPGRLSHTQEWEDTIASLKSEGVDVVFRAGVMAYGPQPSSGKPGRLIIDPEASIGALRHEKQHFLDDKALGFPSMKGLFAAKVRWQMEYNAYMKEVSLARDIRAFGAGKQLVANARTEKQAIIKNFGPVK